MIHPDVIGFLGGIFTTISLLPQLVKIMESKSTKDISFLMYGIFCVGVSLWLIYGFCLTSLPIILSNIVSLALAVTILCYKIKYK